MQEKGRLLLLEDDSSWEQFVTMQLQAFYKIEICRSICDLAKILYQKKVFDIALIDISACQTNGNCHVKTFESILEEIKELAYQTVVFSEAPKIKSKIEKSFGTVFFFKHREINLIDSINNLPQSNFDSY